MVKEIGRVAKDAAVMVRVERARISAIKKHYSAYPIAIAPLFYKWIDEGMKREGIKYNGGK